MTNKNIFDLQFFADGAAAASGTTAGSGESAAASGTVSESAAPNDAGDVVVKYGKQGKDSADNASADNTSVNAGEVENNIPKMYTEEEFKKGKEEAVKKRLKGFEKEKKAVAAEREQMAAICRYCSEVFDCDPSDLGTMSQKANDARKDRYKQESIETGNDPEKIEKTANDRYEGFNYKDQIKRINNERFNERMHTELTEAQKKYPELDLYAEFENSSFRTLINNGFSVLNAYESVHSSEIQEMIRSKAIEEATRKIANDIAAGNNRPQENGAVSSSATQFVTDPSKLTKEQRSDVKKRVRRGEKIFW